MVKITLVWRRAAHDQWLPLKSPPEHESDFDLVPWSPRPPVGLPLGWIKLAVIAIGVTVVSLLAPSPGEAPEVRIQFSHITATPILTKNKGDRRIYLGEREGSKVVIRAPEGKVKPVSKRPLKGRIVPLPDRIRYQLLDDAGKPLKNLSRDMVEIDDLP